MNKKTAVILAAIGIALVVCLLLWIMTPGAGDGPTIPKLSSLSLDTARTSNTADGVQISGARVTSSIYDPDDFLIITYKFNLENQNLEPVRIQAFEDVGSTTSGDLLFFLRDQPAPVQLTENGEEVPSGSAIDVTEGSRKFSVKMIKGQVFGFITRVSSGSGKLKVTARSRRVS